MQLLDEAIMLADANGLSLVAVRIQHARDELTSGSCERVQDEGADFKDL